MDNLIKWALNFFELLASVVGFLYWNKLRYSYWKWFPIYLAVILVVELTGKYILLVAGNVELNIRLYRYFGTPVQFLFFFWLFSRYFKHSKERYWAITGACIYILCALVELYYLSGRKFWFFSFSYTAGNIILIILIMIFFVKLIGSQDILHYKYNMMFWVCLGLLIYYLGTLPFWGLRNMLLASYPKLFRTYWYIQFGFDYLMYIFFVIGFVCSRRN